MELSQPKQQHYFSEKVVRRPFPGQRFWSLAALGKWRTPERTGGCSFLLFRGERSRTAASCAAFRNDSEAGVGTEALPARACGVALCSSGV
eukprot:100054-Prorocentrum_minimum.AAC.1